MNRFLLQSRWRLGLVRETCCINKERHGCPSFSSWSGGVKDQQEQHQEGLLSSPSSLSGVGGGRKKGEREEQEIREDKDGALLEMMVSFCRAMKQTNSVNEKKNILKGQQQGESSGTGMAHHGDFKRLLQYVYSPFKVYGIKSPSIDKERVKLLKEKKTEEMKMGRLKTKKRNTKMETGGVNGEVIDSKESSLKLFELLDALSEGRLTGRSALQAVVRYIESHKEHEDLIKNIIDKNLKIRVGANIVNRVFEGLIPQFQVSLANTFDHDKYSSDIPVEEKGNSEALLDSGESKKKGAKKKKKVKSTGTASLQGWLMSRKLDGVRCIALVKFISGRRDGCDVEDGKVGLQKMERCRVQFFSRAGKQIHSLGHLRDIIERSCELWLKDFRSQIGNKEDTALEFLSACVSNGFVLDGEVCLLDKTQESNVLVSKSKKIGKELFSELMVHLRRKNHTMENPNMFLFDIIPMRDFESAIGSDSVVFSDRLRALRHLEEYFTRENAHCAQVNILNQTIVEDNSHIHKEFHRAIESGWEGLIVRNNSRYEGKRTRNMLKMKQFQDAEYKVKRLEFGKMRLFFERAQVLKTTKPKEKEELYGEEEPGGQEIEVETLKNVIIEHKGEEVSIGSGFSTGERMYFYRNPDELKNAVVTVQYFTESTDKDGKPSLRFPTLKFIHGRKREL
eukprot:Nk52_evm3s355 gene=Nk52_evmTU3s355